MNDAIELAKQVLDSHGEKEEYAVYSQKEAATLARAVLRLAKKTLNEVWVNVCDCENHAFFAHKNIETARESERGCTKEIVRFTRASKVDESR